MKNISSLNDSLNQEELLTHFLFLSKIEHIDYGKK